MAYAATVIPVMIASPGDVEEERRIVRQVLHEWNDINCSSARVALIPVGWETNLSPELGSRPQEIINRRLVHDCDLLVGVFWTRAGTPTGTEPSGTIEEIKEHYGNGKPTMLYFSSKPVSPDSIDADQYETVREFKSWCKSQGLIHEYNDENEFREAFRKHLSITLQQNEYLQEVIEATNHIDGNSSQSRMIGLPLSDDARELLSAAAEDDSGEILAIEVLDGFSIQAGRKSYGGGHGRESAKWRGALEELVLAGFAADRGNKGQVYALTREGWEAADTLG